MNSHDAYVSPSIKMVSSALTLLARRAERRAAPKPARIPSGDRRTYPFDEGLHSLALGAGEAGLDPVFALHARRWIHALGVEALDVLEHHHLLAGVIARLADRGVLDRLVAVAEHHADATSR